jgi:SAM-dependent methyltransferase
MKHPACIAVERGWVEIEEEEVYRYITGEVSKTFIDSQAYADKVDEFWLSATPSSRLPQYDYDKSEIEIKSIYKVEKINHVTHYPEWAPQQVIAALKLLCEIQIYCMQKDVFVETHLWNFALRRGRPILIDLGDFQTTNVHPDIPLQSILGSFREELDNHCPVHMSNFIQNYTSIKNNLIAIQKNNNFSLIEKFSLFREQLNSAKSTTSADKWSDYDKGSWNNIEEIPFAFKDKSRVLCEYIDNKKPSTVLDIGCNTGVYSLYASFKGAECMGIDTDSQSIEKANTSARNRGLNCAFIPFDIMKPSTSWGLGGVYGSLTMRLKSELVIAPAIFHHLLMQNYNPNLIIDTLASFSKKYMCLEYIPHDKEFACRENIWPTEKDVTHRLDCLGFKTVSTNSFPSDRKWILAERTFKE